jgi:hypothetical protein
MPALEKSPPEGATTGVISHPEAAQSQKAARAPQDGHARRYGSKIFTLLF